METVFLSLGGGGEGGAEGYLDLKVIGRWKGYFGFEICGVVILGEMGWQNWDNEKNEETAEVNTELI